MRKRVSARRADRAASRPTPGRYLLRVVRVADSGTTGRLMIDWRDRAIWVRLPTSLTTSGTICAAEQPLPTMTTFLPFKSTL